MDEKKFTTDVLINGAGPTGLMMACQLALHNISFRIIDKKKERGDFSGALIVHALSMEVLHQMGISVKFLKEGIIARKLVFRFKYRKTITVDVADFGNGWSLFPYLLLIEQSKIEKLLMDFLHDHGRQVENDTTLLSFSQKKGVVTSILKKPEGAGEVVTSKFLIGAGGSTCIVRRQLKIPFYGKTYPELLFVSDSDANIPASNAEMIFSFSHKNTLGFFPLSGNRWRIDGTISNLGNSKEKITYEFIEDYLKGDTSLNLQLINTTWFSAFHSHSRHAPVFRYYSCFLAGDAAHIHSPVGAQGMNTGLQDAYNLAWKLAFYLKGDAKPEILDTYQDERLPLAKEIIRYTDIAYRLIAENKLWIKLVRLNILPGILALIFYLSKRIRGVRKFLFKAVSGTGIGYRRSSLSVFYEKPLFAGAYPASGDRLPCLQYFIGSRTYNLHEHVKYTSFLLLVFGINELPESFKAVIAKYNHILQVETISMRPGTEDVFKTLVRNTYACYLVRPDLYIAWHSNELSASGLERYLKTFFISSDESERV